MLSRMMVRMGPLLWLIVLPVAWGQGGLSKDLEGVVPLYPGARLLDDRSVEGVTQVLMEAEDSPNKVIGYYKETMLEGGWTVVTEMTTETEAAVILSKGSSTVLITADAAANGGATLVINLAR